MPGPRPDDNYSPNNSVAPTGAPSDYLNVRANPNQFGAQIGEATQGLGKTLENQGNQLMQTAIQEQGLANEHEATMAELQLAKSGGEIYNQYKNLEGLDASNARGKAVSDYMALNDKIRAGISNDSARRAYDQLATRRMMFTIQDINSYASQQKKVAYKAGQTAVLNQNIEDASRYTVASNDNQFKYAQQSAIFAANTLFTAPEYGDFQSVPAKTNSKTGLLEFDTNTEQGRVAQATYNDYINKVEDKIWSNRIESLFNDPLYGNVDVAVQTLEANKDNISPATYAKLAHSLKGPYRSNQARTIAEQEVGLSEAQYENGFSKNPVGTLQSLAPGLTVTSTARTPEHNAEVGGVPNSYHLKGQAADVILPKGMTFDQFKAKLAESGFSTRELINEGDHVHIAWGDSLGAKDDYISKANYFRQSFPDILDRVRQRAHDQFNDATLEDQAVSHASQKMLHVIQMQDMQTRVDRDHVIDAINGRNTGQRITSIDQLMNGDQKTRDAWIRFQADNPLAAERIENGLITANAKGQALGFGSQFWKNYSDLASGRVKDSTYFSVSGDKNSPFTNTGFYELNSRQSRWMTPEGHTEQQAEYKYLQELHKEYTGYGAGVPGATAEGSNPKFDQVLKEVLPRIAAARKEGKTLTQMFSKTINGKPNPDYIQPSVPTPTLQELLKPKLNMFSGNISTPSGQTVASNTPKTYATYNDLLKDASNLSQEEFLRIGREKGFIGPNAPRPK